MRATASRKPFSKQRSHHRHYRLPRGQRVADFRLWPETDIETVLRNVCFRG
jgi:hypothetical protein